MPSAALIQVKLRAEGVVQTIAQFKATARQAQQSMKLIAAAGMRTKASLMLLAKPIKLGLNTANEVLNLAKMAAGIAAVAAGLAGISGKGILQAGEEMKAIEAGLRVASGTAEETRKAFEDIAETQAIEKMAASMGPLEAKTFKARMAAEKLNREMIEGNRIAATKRREAELFAALPENEQLRLKDVDATAAAAMEMSELRKESKRLGLDLRGAANSYKGFANATKGTAAQGKVTIQAFRGVAAAQKGLSLNDDSFDGILTALSQMNAKSKASAEELQQISERGIPAYAVAARAYGVSGAEFQKMLANGIDAAEFTDKFGAQLAKEYGPAAERAASLPAASFNRLKNAVFEAQAATANGGLGAAIGHITDRLTALVEKFQETGKFATMGAAIGRGIDGLPAMLERIGNLYAWVKMQATEWLRQMDVALGLDFTGFGDRATAGLGKLGALLLQLAFDIPGVIYAMREAFAGNDENVSDRYSWVIPLVAFIRDTVIPTLEKIPGIIAYWLPAFQAAVGMIISTMQGIRNAFFAVFGEETGKKLLAFLILARLTGLLSLFLGVLSGGITIIRAIIASVQLLTSLFALLQAVAAFLGVSTLAAFGIVLAAIAAVVLAGYLMWKYWAEIKTFFMSIFRAIGEGVSTIVDGIKSVWGGLTEILSSPFEAAVKIIKGIFGVIMGLIEASPLGWAFKGGRILFEQSKKVLGFAAGGFVRGAGTSTSDSIPAMLSDREGVIKASAVSHYGGEAFVNGLNSMTLPRPGEVAANDVIEVQSGGGRPFSLVMPGVGAAAGPVSDQFADQAEKLFRKATTGRAGRPKPRGYS